MERTGSIYKEVISAMDLGYLCTNCMQGTLRNGICTYCQSSAQDVGRRPAFALPDRYILGNRYLLGRVIGNGGFGITYMAWDVYENRRLIVKELFPCKDVNRSMDKQTVIPVPGQEDYFNKCKIRFREEAELLHSFRNDPTILNVYRMMEANYTVYYSMEYLNGCDLQTFMRNYGRMTWPQFSVYLRRILYTLRTLHSHRLIHRDVSPDNIFLISDTEAKLIDFGSVRCYNSGNGLTTILKKNFAPPEQYFSNGKQGPWTDIYALCVTTYYALSGVLVPPAPERTMYRNKANPAPLAALCPNIPQNVDAAVRKGMSLNTNDRFTNVIDLAMAIFPGENINNWAPPPGQSSDPNGKHRTTGQTTYGDGYGHTGMQTPPTVKTTMQPDTLRKDNIAIVLRAVDGIYKGREIPLKRGETISFGREPNCTVSYPKNSPGVSRRQCLVECDTYGTLYVRDEKSSFGTYISNRRIPGGYWLVVQRGDILSFGSRERYYIE